jgi:hypothetical protein
LSTEHLAVSAVGKEEIAVLAVAVARVCPIQAGDALAVSAVEVLIVVAVGDAGE